MSDNTQELDEILERYRAAVVGLPSDASVADIKGELLDWHNKQAGKARLNEVQNAYEHWINGRKFIPSYFRERIAELTNKGER